MMPRHWLAAAQGVFYLVLGAWPLVHLRSFEAVTGPKTDDWLVITVGALLTVEGAVLLLASRGRALDAPLIALAAGTAGVLAGVDVVYVARRTIAPVYLLDAAVEVALVGGWAAVASRRRGAG